MRVAEAKRIVIVGATSAMAVECARLWLQRDARSLVLIGRDVVRLSRVSADLCIRAPQAQIETVVAEFLEPAAIQATVEKITAVADVDVVLIAHGSLPDQEQCQNDLALCREALEINGVSPVLFAEAFAAQMAKRNHGTLVLIGSVAGDRGRKSNYVYGAAKGLVTRYAQGLQHRFANSGVRVVLIKPGPTDTPMTAHLKQDGAKLASVEDVALGIVNAAERGDAVAYLPDKWRLIMWVIRHMPAVIFNKLNI